MQNQNIGAFVFLLELCVALQEEWQHIPRAEILFNFLVTVKVAPHECVIRTG